ncbi:MAG: hypothetical protein ACLGI9_01530 [Thermoanaerobaculia bacterium]
MSIAAATQPMVAPDIFMATRLYVSPARLKTFVPRRWISVSRLKALWRDHELCRRDHEFLWRDEEHGRIANLLVAATIGFAVATMGILRRWQVFLPRLALRSRQ